jgi:hypothetical protein
MGNLGETITGDVVGGVKNMEDAFADAIVSGENAFDAIRAAAADAMRDVARSIARSGMNKLFSTAVTAVGAYFTGGAKDGGVIKAATGAGPGRMGGVIRGAGTGTSDSIKGWVVDAYGRVTKGLRVSDREGIVTAEAVSNLGEDGLHYLNRNPAEAAAMIRASMKTPMRRAAGGTMESSRGITRQSAARSSGGGQFNYTSDIKVDGGNSDMDPSTMQRLGKKIDSTVRDILITEQRPGGMLYGSRR